MCRLLDLPPEMVVWVFESLDNIDDALHLARCCKFIHSVFDAPSIRLKIFRSIITHAPQHHYDLALNQSIGMYGGFSSEFYSKPSIPANPDRRRWYLNMLKPLECGEVISDGVVWDVVCRWQGLRLLFDLYVDTAIRKSYVNSVFSYSTGLGMADRTEESASEGDLPKPSQIPSPCANAMIPEDRKSAYERFYKALTAHWVAIETLWKVRTQVWPNAQQFDSAFESAVEVWSNNPGRPLKEKMDIIEIVDFVWGFLGRKAFHVASVPSWIEGEGDLVREQYLDQDETEVGNWGFFVRGVIQFLRPPQIIELVLSSWYSSDWSHDRPGFIRHLGLFDTWEGILVDAQDGPSCDNWVPLNTVDDDVENSLTCAVKTEDIGKQWESYRNVLWPSKIRGHLFLRPTAEREILKKITRTRVGQ